MSVGSGWFRSMSTPFRRSPSPRQEEHDRFPRALPLILFMLLPLGFAFLLLQGQLARHAQRAADAAPRRLANAIFPSELWDNLKRQATGDTWNIGLGYVENTVAEGVVNFLAQAEKDAGREEPKETTDDLPTNKRLSPAPGLGPTVTKPFPPAPKYTKDEDFELTWAYDMDEKLNAYVGSHQWMSQFPKGSRAYYNSLATFAYSSDKSPHRYHGHVGVFENGTQYWIGGPMPEPIEKVNRTEAMRRGGFYLDLANALPLDREPNDTRDDICKDETWDYSKLPDASVVITFFNEPLSTLLRSVHSVLNLTPPPILREIILVDDHSDLEENLPGSELYEYIKLLPKTKLLRLPERRGLVWARLAGAQAAKAAVLVVLDSHVEMNYHWLEPQLARLAESPKSIVYPQIMALDADTFRYNAEAGIGCWLSWKWNMVEQASLTGKISSRAPIPSASMAGGLFAVYLDWFWELGGYDEAMSMWGSENVEMGFRAWMCGGRMECTPCARTYHIYRSGGSGYTSPSENIWRNKLRTARLWMDEWYQVAQKFIGQTKTDLGTLDAVLELKQKLNCKPFSWFLDNVDPTHEGRHLEDIELLGEIRNEASPTMCIDSLGHHKPNTTWGVYYCHGDGGSQGFFKDRTRKVIKTFTNDAACLHITGDDRPIFWSCNDDTSSSNWTIDKNGRLIWKEGNERGERCLSVTEDKKLKVERCSSDVDDLSQRWKMQMFEPDPNFKLPEFSEEYKHVHMDRPADANE